MGDVFGQPMHKPGSGLGYGTVVLKLNPTDVLDTLLRKLGRFQIENTSQ